MNNDYSVRQAERDRAYLGSYDTPEAIKWIESLPPEERKRLEAEGLLKPMLDRCGSTMREEDAGESDLAAEEADIPAAIDFEACAPTAALVPAEPGNDDRLWDVLRRLLGELLNQKNAKLSIECLAVVGGIGFMGDSMTEIANRNGVTRAAVSKRCVELTQKLKLHPSRAMRSLTARKAYARTQHIIRSNHEQRNRKGR